MITVALHGAEFFAYHGFYPEEQVLGNKFIIDIEVTFPPKGDFKEDDLQNTVDYVELYEITASEMKQTKKLIDTVAQSIADRIKEKYPFATSIKVSLKKCNPPMSGRVQYSSIVITL
jgi:7,8-dihydroneopterin aldolase/epimerase/oxygenase